MPGNALKYSEPLIWFVVLHLLRFVKLRVKLNMEHECHSQLQTGRANELVNIPHATFSAMGPSASMSQIKPVRLGAEWYGTLNSLEL